MEVAGDDVSAADSHAEQIVHPVQQLLVRRHVVRLKLTLQFNKNHVTGFSVSWLDVVDVSLCLKYAPTWYEIIFKFTTVLHLLHYLTDVHGHRSLSQMTEHQTHVFVH